MSKFKADPEVAKANLTAALTALKEGIAKLDTPAGFVNHLVRSSRGNLPRYSVNNQILILTQRPQATEVGGFHYWIKKGRKPLAGRGLRILAPATYKKTVAVENEQGETEEVEQLRLRFKAVTVWEIHDTDGPALPEAAPAPTEWHPADTEALPFSLGPEAEELARQLDLELCVALENVYKVRVQEGTHGTVYGCFFPGENRIVVNRSHDAVTNASTIAHEGAHAVVHHTKQSSGNYAVEEQVAEGAAFAYLCRHGLRTDRFSFDYLRSYGGNTRSIVSLLGRIGIVTQALIQATEGVAEQEEAA